MYHNQARVNSLTKIVTAVIIAVLLSFGLSFNKANAQALPAGFATKEAYLNYLYQQVFLLQQQLMILLQKKAQEGSGSSNQNNDRDSGNSTATTNPRNDKNPYFIQINSLALGSIERTKAELKGNVDVGGSKEVQVWFEYGEGNRLGQKTPVVVIDKPKITEFKNLIDGLKPDTRYSYRAVTEDKDGNVLYGQTRDFRTIFDVKSLSFSGSPVVENEKIMAIKNSGGTASGFVSMNDSGMGVAFFVFGSDRTLVDKMDEYSTFKSIPAIKGMADKKSVNANFLGRSTITSALSGLPKASTIYFRTCVEYGGNMITCSRTNSFVTAN